ncbi:MAG TPA: sensor histidine kinase [Caulobacteraceae bacterium]|nr:sensor histidine kinase [Caulobacteraceae bacterium]
MAQTNGDDPKRQAEVRHKIANLFQLLSTLTRLRMQRAQEAESRRDLGSLLEMVSALALVHQRVLSPGGEDFALCLGDMADHWRRRCAGRPIAIELTAAPLAVHESHASALALIANELVANALARGFPDERAGVIRVALERAGDDRAALSVTDDGIGYDPATVDDARLGLWLIKGLAAQVRGDLSTTADNGVSCRLEFPG